MSYTARDLLERFNEKPGILELGDFFEEDKNGNGCRWFWVFHEGNKRRALICVTQECVEDKLQEEGDIEKAVAHIEAYLASMQERVKVQSKKLEKEPDYVLYSSML